MSLCLFHIGVFLSRSDSIQFSSIPNFSITTAFADDISAATFRITDGMQNLKGDKAGGLARLAGTPYGRTERRRDQSNGRHRLGMGPRPYPVLGAATGSAGAQGLVLYVAAARLN
ncbi:hypothetical protein LOAG_05619 [Loa loa]|uniref:Uncharacterized protein n=1 Tax=Loa loa TaxID=7209 RepID=A0A1S0TZN2_LOALO|nr:hypothetical protein LOAG_05619 [Loa loa]EFO22863.1 hypothetical protein LOAG_05619 [Loa loa]